MSEVRIKRLRELADAVTKGADGEHEFTMRVPAERDRDADLVLSWAADEIERLTALTEADAEEIGSYWKGTGLRGENSKFADEIERLIAERRELFRAGFFAGVDEFCPDDVHISDLATLEENQWHCRKWAEENTVQDTEGGDR